MKKQLLVALLGAAVALPLAAQAEGAYIGLNVGRAEAKASTGGQSIKEHDTGYKIDAGVDFTNNFGVEAGYADLGKYDGNDARAIYVAGTGAWPLDAQLALIAKIGASRNRVKFGDTGQKFNHTAAIVGVGATYNFSKNLIGVLEYENFGRIYDERDGNIKADMWSVGLRYKF